MFADGAGAASNRMAKIAMPAPVAMERLPNAGQADQMRHAMTGAKR
jgi:hypothetical protein